MRRTTSLSNRIGLLSLALFIIGFLLVAFCSCSQHDYADFDCPICGSDHVLDCQESAICPDCLTSFLY